VLCNHPFLSRLHDTSEEEALGPHPVSSLVRASLHDASSALAHAQTHDMR
jgi:hypothetical protein